jgi:hypothetical protein
MDLIVSQRRERHMEEGGVKTIVSLLLLPH